MNSPSPIIKLATGYWASRTFLAAVHLGYFKVLPPEGMSVKSLSEKSALPENNARMLSRILNELELVLFDESKDFVSPTEATTAFLNPTSPMCLAGSLEYAREMYPVWNGLEQCLLYPEKTKSAPSKKDTPSFIQAMHDRAAMLAPVVLPELNMEKGSLLDVAAGAGSWSILLSQKISGLELTLLEQEELCSHMKNFALAKGLPKSAQFVGADYHHWEAKNGQRWKNVLYFGALHQEPESGLETLLEKLWNWVEPDGSLWILDLFYGEREPENLFAWLFGFNMMLTGGGSIHHLDKVHLLAQKLNGLEELRLKRIQGLTPYYLLTARRKKQ